MGQWSVYGVTLEKFTPGLGKSMHYCYIDQGTKEKGKVLVLT